MTPYKDLAIRYPPTKPMPVEEQDRLVALAKDGDGKARNALIEQYMPMIMHIIERAQWAHKHREDLVGQCVIAAYNCINSYDIDGGRSFSTYLWNGIKMKLSVLRKETQIPKGYQRSRREIPNIEIYSLDTTIGEATGYDNDANSTEDNRMINSIACETDYIEMSDTSINANIIKSMFDNLDDIDKDLMTLRYFSGTTEMTMNEIGKAIGITKAGVSLRIIKSIKTLREIYENNQD